MRAKRWLLRKIGRRISSFARPRRLGAGADAALRDDRVARSAAAEDTGNCLPDEAEMR